MGKGQGKPSRNVQSELIKKYERTGKQILEYKGYLAEVQMSQVLWNTQRKILPGRFFNHTKDVKMPDMFVYIEHRHRIGSGKDKEIDVLGAAGGEEWICQSKWLSERKVGMNVLKMFYAQGELMKRERDPIRLRMWLFANAGLTVRLKFLHWRTGFSGLLGRSLMSCWLMRGCGGCRRGYERVLEA
ncbi:hypothetical protein QUF76_07480 [Desulfobacterales bacterium HSG16]|nr:hypothetical protein [Desulfobacterales bacterium HSG16]